MSDFKKTAGGVAQAVCGLAALVFLLAPITTKHGLEVGGAALVIAILAAGVQMWAKRDRTENSE
jgi:hypothetical protein